MPNPYLNLNYIQPGKQADERFKAGKCPNEERLLAYEAGFLSPTEYQETDYHLATCLMCKQIVEELAKIAQVADPLLERVAASGKQTLPARLLPAPAQPAFALLGDEETEQSYEAGPYQVILETTPLHFGSDIWQIEGKIMNSNDPEMVYQGHVSLFEGNQAIAKDEIDEFGFFALEDLSVGQYTMHIEFSSTIIPIEKIDLS